MGFTVPPNVPYQPPLFPIRGLWNRKPPEGDRVVPVEIDWGSQSVSCVKFDAGNSTSPFSQLVAMTVDNTNNGSDIEIIFLDSGFQFVVAAYAQPVAVPIFTNGLSFYVNCPNASANAVTRLFMHNSLPPPVQPAITQQQQFFSQAGGINLASIMASLIAAGIDGTLTGFNISVIYTTTAAVNGDYLHLNDGAGHVLWGGAVSAPNTTSGTYTFSQSGLRIPFRNGLSIVQAVTAMTGTVYPNVFYGVP